MEHYTPAEDRYSSRSANWFRRCGRSGLMLPAISLGCWHNFGAAGTGSARLDQEDDFHDNCQQMLFTAFDLGITHFDLANNYGPPPGSAEERVGRILRQMPRDELIISSKAGYRMWPGPYGEWGSRKSLLASLDQSLKRLGLDYVDIFYSHRPDPDTGTPLEETLGALDQAVKSGKALYTGISSYRGVGTAEVLRTCDLRGWMRPIIHQPSYNMLNRWIENDLLPHTEKAGVGLIVFCPLAQGLLTGKYLNGVPEDSRAAGKAGFLKADSITPELVAKLSKLDAIAKARNQTLAQMALSWVLRLPGVTSALIGAGRPEQIKENVAAVERTDFADEELKRIDEILHD